VAENVGVARAGYDYAGGSLYGFSESEPRRRIDTPIMSGNIAMAMGGAGSRCEVLLCLSDESFDRRAALDGGARAQSGHHGAPVEDEIGVINRRSARLMPASAPCALHRAADSP